MYNLIRRFGIKEVARTGRVAMTRGITGLPPTEGRSPGTRGKRQKAG
ncbi:MAG: hypothetical protein ACYS21_12775 [Planctomycetota bacterium]